MRKIFLDLGAHKGESVRFFREYQPDADQYEVFCFEPLPNNIERLHELEGITIIPAAAYIRDGEAKFYTGLAESGSLCDKKRSGKLDGQTHITVKTIDFPRWFKELISGDYVPEVTLKMNIEGAEYPIIQKMNNHGLLSFVKKMYIQWHYDKIGLAQSEHNRVKGLLPESKTFAWEAMFGNKFKEYFLKTI